MKGCSAILVFNDIVQNPCQLHVAPPYPKEWRPLLCIRAIVEAKINPQLIEVMPDIVVVWLGRNFVKNKGIDVYKRQI